MERNYKTLKEKFSRLNDENIMEFYNPDYYFQDVVEELGNDKSDIPVIFEKFLYSYLSRVAELIKFNTKESNNFIEWFNNKAQSKMTVIFNEECNLNIDVKKFKKVLANYDVLLEQAVDEEDVDCLLDILMDIPTNLHQRMKEWKCFEVQNTTFDYENFETYKSNESNSYFIDSKEVPDKDSGIFFFCNIL